jgi:hypothetical protein
MLRVRVAVTAAALFAVSLPARAAGQDFHRYFQADLNGASVVPPSGSTGTAVIGLMVTPDESAAIILGRYIGLSSAGAGGALRGPAAPGATGPVIASFASGAGVSGSISGTVLLTPLLLSQLKAGLLYVELRSAHFPDGELRGQVLAATPLIGLLNGAQAVPGNGTTGVGHTIWVVNAAGTIASFYIEWSGLSSPAQLLIRGPAPAGSTGPILINFGSGFPTAFAATGIVPFSPTQIADLKAGLYSIDLPTEIVPSGEIKGQIKYVGNVTDWDADGGAEAAVFRTSGNMWFRMNLVSFGVNGQAFGLASDTRTPADFDGDGKTDLAVWRNGTFFVLESRSGILRGQPWGVAGDDPRIVADYDGDGRADFAVYRPGAQSFIYVLRSLDGGVMSIPFGTTNDRSIFGDYDGDRKNDIAVYRPSVNTFFVLRSLDGALVAQPWGNFVQDWITPGDYDGDDKWDYAVWRGLTGGDGVWYILQSTTGTLRAQPFGIAATSDASVMADYDGDGKTDIAIARNSGGVQTWYILRSLTGSLMSFVFGVSSDQAIQLYLRR